MMVIHSVIICLFMHSLTKSILTYNMAVVKSENVTK